MGARVVELATDDESDTPVPPKPKPATKKASTRELVDDDEGYSPWVDVLRVLSFLVFASCGLSYLISGGESFTWNMRAPPKYLQVDWWKSQFVRVFTEFLLTYLTNLGVCAPC